MEGAGDDEGDKLKVRIVGLIEPISGFGLDGRSAFAFTFAFVAVPVLAIPLVPFLVMEGTGDDAKDKWSLVPPDDDTGDFGLMGDLPLSRGRRGETFLLRA
mmetsp:Transcript_32160/g.74001  ORF Transcript_32160/g.74001 Transcript_32160/m.74001 type:complete len:101 (+) Transcript_32160:1493-1795(+)